MYSRIHSYLSNSFKETSDVTSHGGPVHHRNLRVRTRDALSVAHISLAATGILVGFNCRLILQSIGGGKTSNASTVAEQFTSVLTNSASSGSFTALLISKSKSFANATVAVKVDPTFSISNRRTPNPSSQPTSMPSKFSFNARLTKIEVISMGYVAPIQSIGFICGILMIFCLVPTCFYYYDRKGIEDQKKWQNKLEQRRRLANQISERKREVVRRRKSILERFAAFYGRTHFDSDEINSQSPSNDTPLSFYSIGDQNQAPALERISGNWMRDFESATNECRNVAISLSSANRNAQVQTNERVQGPNSRRLHGVHAKKMQQCVRAIKSEGIHSRARDMQSAFAARSRRETLMKSVLTSVETRFSDCEDEHENSCSECSDDLADIVQVNSNISDEIDISRNVGFNNQRFNEIEVYVRSVHKTDKRSIRTDAVMFKAPLIQSYSLMVSMTGY